MIANRYLTHIDWHVCVHRVDTDSNESTGDRGQLQPLIYWLWLIINSIRCTPPKMVGYPLPVSHQATSRGLQNRSTKSPAKLWGGCIFFFFGSLFLVLLFTLKF